MLLNQLLMTISQSVKLRLLHEKELITLVTQKHYLQTPLSFFLFSPHPHPLLFYFLYFDTMVNQQNNKNNGISIYTLHPHVEFLLY